MSSYKEVKNELLTYLYAKTPLVLIKSCERERVERLISEVSVEINKDIYGFSTARNIFKFPSMQTTEKSDIPTVFIMDFFRKKRNQIFALLDVSHLGDDNIFSRDILNSVYLARESQSTLIIVTGDSLWNRLVNLGLITTLSLPNDEEREQQLTKFINDYHKLYTIDYNQEDIVLASSVLKGFSESQIDNILSSSLVKEDGLFKKNIFKLCSQKKQIFDSISTVELIENDDPIDLAGLENFKKYLADKKKIFFSPIELLKKHGLSYPKGFLLTGIPGCGKSMSAKYAAQAWNLPLYKFDLDTIFNKWMGESERRMHDALEYIENMAPCVLWIDEIEKALSTSSDGNDTGKRIVGQFLFWLQESRCRVFLIATANDITKLPSELFRKGRFSEIFYIDLPNSVERRQCIKFYVENSLHINLSEEELTKLVDLSFEFTYADIEMAVKTVAEKLIIDENYVLSVEHIIDSFEKTISYSKTNPEVVKKYRAWGTERAVNASILERK